MNTDEILNNYRAFSDKGVAFVEMDFSSISVSGPDALDFLQRMTSQDLRQLPTDTAVPNALLTPTGLISHLFDVVNLGGIYWLFGPVGESSSLVEDLEKFHFVEDLEIRDRSSEFKFFKIFGSCAENVSIQDLGVEITQNQNRILQVSTIRAGELRKKLASLGIAELAPETFRLLTLEAGGAEFGRDFKPRSLVLEAPLENHISRTKGCYPGQEVVERVFTYGNVAKKIVGLKFLSSPSNIDLLAEAKLQAPEESKEAGTLMSAAVIPWTQKIIGRALVKKPYYLEGQKLVLKTGSSDIGIDVEIYELPNSFKISSEKVRV